MNPHEPIGYLASLLVLVTFCMRDLVLLRAVAIASNLAFIAYSLLAEINPVLWLHTLLLPVNVYRLCEALRNRGSKNTDSSTPRFRALTVVVPAAVLLASSGLAQGLTVHSIRSDLQAVGALVSMSRPTPIRIEGFKTGYQYALTTRNLLERSQTATYSLLLGSRRGGLVDAFSLTYAGTRAEFSADAFGQLLGFMARTCLGADRSVTQASAREMGNLLSLALTSGKPQSVARAYGSLSMSIVNLKTDGVRFGFQMIFSSTATPGTGGWVKTCIVQP